MIRRRPYRILCDFPYVYDFLTEIYAPSVPNGVGPAFFEYGESFQTFDYAHSHRIALWEEDGTRLVAVAFYEIALGEAFLNLRPGYERLADEMIAYAAENFADEEGALTIMLTNTQTALRESAARLGFQNVSGYPEGVYPYAKGKLPYRLPEGYRFLDNAREARDVAKLDRCLWDGFDHEGEPDGDLDFRLHMFASPHFRADLDAIVVAPDGSYAAYAGMWLIDRVGLAYLEPLCVVPAHRRKGIAAAAIAELQRRTEPLGATHITGGSNAFYFKIGYEELFRFERWRRSE